MPFFRYRGSYTQYQGDLQVFAAPGGAAGGSIVTTDLTHHFDAGNTSSYGGSGTTWTNLVGNGYNLGLIGSPTFVSNGVSSYFIFNGTNQWASGSGYLGSAAERRNFTINFVLNFGPLSSTFADRKFWADNQNPTTLLVGSATTVNQITYMQFTDGNTNFFADLIPYANPPTGYTFNTGTNYMMTIVSSATKVDLYMNGTFISSSTEPFTATNTMNSATRDFGYAVSDTRADFVSMSIAHIMFYSSSLSAADITQNYNALKSRYGI